jgi:hypothetical protein
VCLNSPASNFRTQLAAPNTLKQNSPGRGSSEEEEEEEEEVAQRLAEPSQLRRISREIRVNRRGKFFALNKTFSQALVVETYPLCRRIKFWHSATENVSAQQYADQGWEGTPLLHGGGKSAAAIGESSAAPSVVLGRNQRQPTSGMAQNAGGV